MAFQHIMNPGHYKSLCFFMCEKSKSEPHNAKSVSLHLRSLWISWFDTSSLKTDRQTKILSRFIRNCAGAPAMGYGGGGGAAAAATPAMAVHAPALPQAWLSICCLRKKQLGFCQGPLWCPMKNPDAICILGLRASAGLFQRPMIKP